MRRCRLERKRRDMKITDVARATGMNASTISGIETGYIGRPYPKQLAALCAVLEWPHERAEELLDEVGDHDESSD